MTDTLVYLITIGTAGLLAAGAAAAIAKLVHWMLPALRRQTVIVISALPVPLSLWIKAYGISAEYTARLRLDLTAWERDGDAIGYGVLFFICVIAGLGAFVGGLIGAWLLMRRNIQ